MKTLIVALSLLPLFAHATPSKECANITAISDLTKKAFVADGPMFAVRVSDIQVETPLHPVANLVSFEIADGVLKMNIANLNRFSAVRKSCAREDIIQSYATAACKMGEIINTLQPMHIDRPTMSQAADEARDGRAAVDNAQPSAEVMSKSVSELNKHVSLDLVKVWNEVSGSGLDFRKKRFIEEDIAPLKASLERMVTGWTGQPVDCSKL